MRLSRSKKSWLALFAGLSFIVFILLSSVFAYVFQKSFYEEFYEKEHLAQELDISEEELNESLFSMLDFVQSKTDSIASIFNEKEVEHMKDVKSLYELAKKVQWICLGVTVCIVLIFYKVERRHMFSFLAKGFIQASFCFLFFIGVLALWAWIDFTDFWYRIHTLFFTNELWIMDPRTDFMILICPENMFSALCLKTGLTFIFIVLTINLGSFWYLLKKSVIGFDKFD